MMLSLMTERIGLLAFWKNYDRKLYLRAAELADDLGYDSFWVPEAWGYDVFSVITEMAVKTKRIKLGTAIVNVFSRSPGLLAMNAATLDEISEGRFIRSEELRSQALPARRGARRRPRLRLVLGARGLGLRRLLGDHRDGGEDQADQARHGDRQRLQPLAGPPRHERGDPRRDQRRPLHPIGRTTIASSTCAPRSSPTTSATTRSGCPRPGATTSSR